jgi:hypothetical protein
VYDYTEPPLTRAALEDLLESLGVRPDTYSLYGAHLPDAIVMDQRPDGWVVFYTERGEESLLRTHTAESAACLDLLERVTSWDHNFFEMVAGPALPEAADAEFDAWLAERSLTREDLGPDEWKSQDSAWVRNEPDYRRYWVRTASIRRRL